MSSQGNWIFEEKIRNVLNEYKLCMNNWRVLLLSYLLHIYKCKSNISKELKGILILSDVI